MANKVIATVNIVLRTATVSRAGFGTPIFIATHRGFQERIRSYASTDEVAEDFDTSSPVYVAATRVFSHDVSVSTFKVGRRESDSNTYTPENVEEGSVTSITVTVNDGDSVVASHTTGSAEDAEDIVIYFTNCCAYISSSFSGSVCFRDIGEIGYIEQVSGSVWSNSKHSR